jgi:hypothetical protein
MLRKYESEMVDVQSKIDMLKTRLKKSGKKFKKKKKKKREQVPLEAEQPVADEVLTELKESLDTINQRLSSLEVRKEKKLKEECEEEIKKVKEEHKKEVKVAKEIETEKKRILKKPKKKTSKRKN